MRGSDEQTSHMFSYVVPEQRVRQDHPLRAIRRMTDEVLMTLSPRFERMYSDMGRPSIPPEQLLRALLLQSLYTIRSERLLRFRIWEQSTYGRTLATPTITGWRPPSRSASVTAGRPPSRTRCRVPTITTPSQSIRGAWDPSTV